MKLKWIETYNGFLIKVKHISSLSFGTFETNTKGVSESIILVKLFNGGCYRLKKYNHNVEYIDNNGFTYSGKEAIESDFERIKECLTTNLFKISLFDKSMYLKELSLWI